MQQVWAEYFLARQAAWPIPAALHIAQPHIMQRSAIDLSTDEPSLYQPPARIQRTARGFILPVSLHTFKHHGHGHPQSPQQVTQAGNIPMALAMLRSHPALPFFSAATGIATFSVMDAVMKSASVAAGVYNAMLYRSVIAASLVLPLWLLGGDGWPGRPALKVHATRSAVVSVMALTWFWGLVRTPLAQGIALSFIAPLITLYLAAVILGERIERRTIIASVLGFAGVIVIVSGGLAEGGVNGDRGWGIAAILASAVLYAWNLILQRQQAQVADPLEIVFFQTAIVALILGLAAPWLAQLPKPAALFDITSGAALTVASLMLLSWGYARAEAQALVPIEYSAFIWAAIMGWLWFAEPVTMATLAGTALIVIGCWIAVRHGAVPVVP